MNDLTFVKLGGSVITDKSKPYTARHYIIEQLAKEIKQARQVKELDIIVGHGGGSFPHTSAAKYQTHLGVIDDKGWEGFAKVQNDAAKLNRIVVDIFLKNNINAVSVQPSAICMCENRKIIDFHTESIKQKLKNNIIPIVYGDVALDKKQGFCIISTEEIFRYLGPALGCKKIILVGKVDGVLDENNKVIPEITKQNFNEIRKHLQGSDGTDVTGGMLHKVEKMLELTEKGIETLIINGEKENNLKDALMGKNIGTVIRK